MLCCSTLIISKKPEHHTQPPKMYGVINVERQLAVCSVSTYIC